MTDYLLDTNVITAYLKHNRLVLRRFREAVTEGCSVMLSAMSYYETRRGLLYAGASRQLAAFERLWEAQGIVMMDKPVLDRAAVIYAELRSQGQLIEDADILIGAMSLVHDLTLVTHNVSHFARIADLRLEDWMMPDGET